MLKVLNYVNISKMQEISNCAWGDVWQGMVRHKLGKVCKTHTPDDQNMLTKFN